MRPIMMKFNNDRVAEYRIVTAIYQNEVERTVMKMALVPEAECHIRHIYENQKVLQDIYPEVAVCKVKLENNVLWFEYMNGKTLGDEYEEVIERKDKRAFEDLLLLQKHMILSCIPSNFCDFFMTEDYENIFGDGAHFIGQKAMKIADFEFTSRNIIVEDQKFNFGLIDYEYVFCFPVPVVLVLYHCIVKANMWTINGFSTLMSVNEILEILSISNSIEELEAAWERFDYHFGRSLIAEAKLGYKKEIIDYTGLKQAYEEIKAENLGHENYISLLTRDLNNQQEYIKILNEDVKSKQKNIESLNTDITEQQNNILHQRAIIKMKENEIAEQETRHRSDIENLQQELSATQHRMREEQYELEKVRGELEEIKKSLIWKTTAPMRMFLDRIRQ